jgi:hypothetical protein
MTILGRTEKNVTVLLEDVLLSYCYVAQPYVSVDKKTGAKKATYTTHGIFAPGSKAHQTMSEALAEVAKIGWGAQWESVIAQLKGQDRMCMHEGNVTKRGAEPYKDMRFVSMSSDRRPRVVVTRNGKNVDIGPEDPLYPYSGCRANLIADIWPQKADSGWGMRVNAGWTGVQFLQHGEPLSGGGRVAAPEEFPTVETAGADAPAPTAAAGGGLI